MKVQLKYLLLIACVTLSVIVLLWNVSSNKQEIKSKETKTHIAKKTNTKSKIIKSKNKTSVKKLPDPTYQLEKYRYMHSERMQEENLKTIEGEVTDIDWCGWSIKINDVTLDMGNLDLSNIQIGDHVRATYIETNYGKIMRSINVLR